MASSKHKLSPQFLVLPSLLSMANQPEQTERNRTILEHYGYLLGGLPGVGGTRISMATLRQQLEHDIYGVVAVVPHSPWVVGVLHFQVHQEGFGCTTFTPIMVMVNTFTISDIQVQEALMRLMYQHLREHLLSRWWLGLSSSGYPSMVLCFRSLHHDAGRRLVSASTVFSPHKIELADVPSVRPTHPKEALIPLRRR
jgi:hypothetical protein